MCFDFLTPLVSIYFSENDLEMYFLKIIWKLMDIENLVKPIFCPKENHELLLVPSSR